MSQDSPDKRKIGSEVTTIVKNGDEMPKPSTDIPSLTTMDDPEAFLATINASLLPESSVKLEETTTRDGYLTDSTTTTKRGRSKQPKSKKTRTRPSSPTTGDEDTQAHSSGNNTLGKKRSFFNMMARSRSASRDKPKDKRAERSPTPPPVPPMPIILPIAERFARSSTSSPMPGDLPSISPEPPRPSFATEIQSADALSLNSITTSSTLVPPIRELLRTASPLSYMNAISSEPIEPLDTTVHELEPARAHQTAQENKDEKVFEGALSSLTVPVPDDGSREGISKSTSRPTSPSDLRPVSPNTTRGGKLGRLFAFATNFKSSDNNNNNHNSNTPTTKISASLISGPNPLLAREPQHPPNSQDIASAINSRVLTPTSVREQDASQSHTLSQATRPSEDCPAPASLGQSTQTTDADAPPPPDSSSEISTSYLSLSPTQNSVENNNDISNYPSSPTRQTLATRRAVNIRALSPSLGTANPNFPSTPSPSSSNTPNFDEVMATRQAVLQYYAIPPPSPPPTGPLPPPPPSSEDRAGSPSTYQREDRLQPPLRSLGTRVSRASSPLRQLFSPDLLNSGGSDLISRSPSPRLAAIQQGSVRRGRESPFPTRPVLPPQDSRDLVERVQRYKAMYSSENVDNLDDFIDESDDIIEQGVNGGGSVGSGRTSPGRKRNTGFGGNSSMTRKRMPPTTYRNIADDPYEDAEASSDDGIVDTRSSAYIRAARARGEKRVYFASGVPVVVGEYDEGEADGDNAGEGGRGKGELPSSEWDVLPAELEDPIAEQNGYLYSSGTQTPTSTSVSPSSFHPEIRIEGDDGNISIEVDDNADFRSHYPVDINGGLNESDPNIDAGESVEDVSRRGSIASMSVYSRYSVLEPERSAQVRDGFVRSVAALRQEWESKNEVIPDVPSLPPDLKKSNFYYRPYTEDGKGSSPIASNPAMGSGSATSGNSRYKY